MTPKTPHKIHSQKDLGASGCNLFKEIEEAKFLAAIFKNKQHGKYRGNEYFK